MASDRVADGRLGQQPRGPHEVVDEALQERIGNRAVAFPLQADEFVDRLLVLVEDLVAFPRVEV
jgi:hypothetical protein